MFGIQLSRTRGKLVLVADVGSSSVAIAIARVGKSGPATILHAGRSILPIVERPPEATGAAFSKEIPVLMDKLLKEFAAKEGGAPAFESVYCVFHAPWTHSGSAKATRRFSSPTAVTASVIGALAQEALSKVPGIDAASVLEASAVRVEINGYPTGSPVGKRASEVAVTALVSDCNTAIKKAVESALASFAPHSPRIMRSATRALLGASREDVGGGDCLIVDIAGEGTIMDAVYQGVPVGESSVAEGVRTILRKITPAASPDETLTLIRMLARDDCSEPACEQVQAAISKLEPELVRTFGEGMAKIAASRKLPEKLILLTYPDMSEWLSHFFSRIDFTQFTQTTQPFSVKALAAKDVAAFVVPDRDVYIDCGLAISAALVNIERGSE